MDNYRGMFESRIPAEATEKYKKQELSGNLMPKRRLHGPYDMEGHAKKCMERCCEFANKTTEQFIQKSRRHAWMIIISKNKKMDQVENCPQFAHKLFSNVYIWHVFVDLIFYGP